MWTSSELIIVQSLFVFLGGGHSSARQASPRTLGGGFQSHTFEMIPANFTMSRFTFYHVVEALRFSTYTLSVLNIVVGIKKSLSKNFWKYCFQEESVQQWQHFLIEEMWITVNALNMQSTSGPTHKITVIHITHCHLSLYLVKVS